MANNLDGIKKLNPEEIKKNRKIVLDYIGEKDVEAVAESVKTPRPESREAIVSNRVDGIRLNKTVKQPAPAANKQMNRPEKIKRAELIKKEFTEKAKRRKDEERAKADEAAKKEIAKKAKFEAEKRAKAEAERQEREKIKLAEKLRETERIKRENEGLLEMKRAEEIKRISEEVKLAKIKQAAKKKIKRQKAFKLFKKNLYDRLNKIFTAVKKNMIYGALYLIVSLIVIYVFFCLLVLRFKIDNRIAGRITQLLPVPAAITSRGIINYNDWRYLDNYSGLSLVEKKSSLAGWLILKKLSRKYGLPLNSPDKALGIAFTKDADFNQAGLLRIKKIQELLKNDGNLEELSKYADEFSDIVYYNSESAMRKFGPAIFDLNDNQKSDIIFRDSGYYIAQVVSRTNKQLGIKHLFVGAKTLEQYLKEEIAKIKVFVLVN